MPRSDLVDLIQRPHTAVADIAELLDAVEDSLRWALVSTLDRTWQRALYRMAEPGPLALADLVPGAAVGTEVIHDGMNTLSVPAKLRRFQKRFCRSGDDGLLYGYNEGPTRRLLGPGYFVARPVEPDPARASIMIDYERIPDGPVAAGWPPVVPNTKGLQRFVYHGTVDYLRRVSQHVSIGAAFSGVKPLDHYFVLCRRA